MSVTALKSEGEIRVKQNRKRGSILVALLVNLFLNLEWSIPAWVLLALHFWLKISIWWFVAGLGIWILRILAGMWLMGWAIDCGNQKDPPKENKNPYSVKNQNSK